MGTRATTSQRQKELKAKGYNPRPETRAKLAEVLELHARGMTITRACKQVGVDMVTVWTAKVGDADFRERYEKAREEHAHAAAAQAVDIADGRDDEWLREALDVIEQAEHASMPTKQAVAQALINSRVQRDRLRCDARKWYTAKALPRIYGDKVDVTSNGEKLQPGVVALPAEAWGTPTPPADLPESA